MNTDRGGRCIEDFCIVEAILISAAIDALFQTYDNDGHYECIDFRQVAFSGAVGGLTGGVGGRLFTGYLRGLSIGAKGDIGETLSTTLNRLKGSRQIAPPNSLIRGTGLTTIADSQWRSIFGNTYIVESKFGLSKLSSAQRIAQQALGDAYRVEQWSYGFFAGVGAAGGGVVGGSAVGLGSR